MQKRLHAGRKAITEHEQHVLAELRQINKRLERLEK
jgi:hypothetical protein